MRVKLRQWRNGLSRIIWLNWRLAGSATAANAEAVVVKFDFGPCFQNTAQHSDAVAVIASRVVIGCPPLQRRKSEFPADHPVDRIGAATADGDEETCRPRQSAFMTIRAADAASLIGKINSISHARCMAE